MAERKVSEHTIRITIGMMRSLASNLPISPFHLAAADDMEKMLKELLGLRKQVKEKEWVSLTDAEMCECYNSPNVGYAVEAKLKEKNT